MRALLCLVMLAVLSACSTYSIEELRHTPPKGTPFQAALALEYLRFSEDEARNVDWMAAGYFAQKGLQAAYGQDVPPEEVSHWYSPPDIRSQLLHAHAALLAALTPEHKTAQPQLAARAQMGFDCWVKAVDGGWSDERTADCRDTALESIQALEGAPTPLAARAAAAEGVDEEQEAAHAPAPQHAAYMVVFASGEAALDGAARQTVDSIAADIQKEQQDQRYTVVLNGHTDTVGKPRYNFALSKRRAEAVKHALITRGIPEAAIHTFGFGETDPRVPTPDSTPEPRNRRVEIFLGG